MLWVLNIYLSHQRIQKYFHHRNLKGLHYTTQSNYGSYGEKYFVLQSSLLYPFKSLLIIVFFLGINLLFYFCLIPFNCFIMILFYFCLDFMSCVRSIFLSSIFSFILFYLCIKYFFLDVNCQLLFSIDCYILFINFFFEIFSYKVFLHSLFIFFHHMQHNLFQIGRAHVWTLFPYTTLFRSLSLSIYLSLYLCSSLSLSLFVSFSLSLTFSISLPLLLSLLRKVRKKLKKLIWIIQKHGTQTYKEHF